MHRGTMTCSNSADGRTRIQTRVHHTIKALANCSVFLRINGEITLSTQHGSWKCGTTRCGPSSRIPLPQAPRQRGKSFPPKWRWESLDCSPAPGGPQSSKPDSPSRRTPRHRRPFGPRGPAQGLGRGRGTERRAHPAPTHQSPGPHQGARVRPAIPGEVGTRVPTLPSPHGYPSICSPRSPAGRTPASASGSPGGHMTRGAESGAGRHVTACGRRLMTSEPALAASAPGEGS